MNSKRLHDTTLLFITPIFTFVFSKEAYEAI